MIFRYISPRQVESEKLKAKADLYNLGIEETKAMISSDDIIYLNVGGQKITTRRSTLCAVEGSLLASMFSGRWEDGIERDKDGCVFLDFNPLYFGLILDYLRAKKIESPDNRPPTPKVAPEQVKNFYNLVHYLGLEEELKPKYVFKLHSSGITIEENGTVALHEPLYGKAYVLSDNVCEEIVTRWQLKLETIETKFFWMFVGVLKGGPVPFGDPVQDSSRWSGSYGWVLGRSGQVYIDGQPAETDERLETPFKEGDIIEVLLDCSIPMVSMHIPNGDQFQINLPSSTSWRLNIGLTEIDDKIRII